MEQYQTLLKEILVNGDVQFDPRTEEHVLGLGGYQSIYDLRKGFPIVTTKKIAPRLFFEELLWKLRGERNIKSLFDNNIHIWDDNAFQKHLQNHGLTKDYPKHSVQWENAFEAYKKRLKEDPDFSKEGDLGPVYGFQWRHWEKRDGTEVDQITKLLKRIREKPGSRYHILNSWNVGDLDDMAIGPCPILHQFTVYGDKLDLNMYQRSCDVYLGVPFNIAQDSLLAHLVANDIGNLEPRKFIHSYGNVHIYLGVTPRANFWEDKGNVNEFQSRARSIVKPEQYLELREWYLGAAGPESEVNARKDHMPYVLEQLSKEPRGLPTISVKKMPLMDAINMRADEIVKVDGYDPHIWDCRARMAA